MQRMKQRVLVDVANRQKKRLPIRRIKAITKEIISQESRVMGRESRVRGRGLKGDKRLSIVFVNDIEIAELNKRFREKDMPTDVLAFPLSLESEVKSLESEKNGYIGEVIISTERAMRQAEEYGHSFVDEVVILTIHGILHILHYEHSKEMEKKEEFYLLQFKICNLKFTMERSD